MRDWVVGYTCEQCRMKLHPSQVVGGRLRMTVDGQRYADPLPRHKVVTRIDGEVRSAWHDVRPEWACD